MEEPQFEHDCDKCLFLGRHEETDPMWAKQYDLYYCANGGMPDTVIARFGDDGPEYTSGMCIVGVVPPITEAHRRAIERGIEIKAKTNAEIKAFA